MSDGIKLYGDYRVEWRDDDGTITHVDEGSNLITTVGLTHILSTEFAAGTQSTSWYIGLISSTSFDEITAGDTMSSHAGWTEFQNYAGGSRKQWTPLSVSGAVLTNLSPVQFVFSASGTVQGFFITNSSTLGGTTGTLWNAAELSTPRTKASGGSVSISYTLRASGGS